MSIKRFRDKIDLTDRAIIKLLNKRAGFSRSIGKIKNDKGIPVYAPNRERDIYGKIKKLNDGPIPDKSLRAIYREVMSSSLNLEKPLKIAYLGPELTFTHIAAMGKFGASVSYEPCKNISDVFAEVTKDKCGYGVVPVENSSEGVVNHTLDMFVDSSLKICAETYLEISHNLLGNARDYKKIKKIYSHPQVFGQCRLWLETNLPNAELVETSSTAEAAKNVIGKRKEACIASMLAKESYKLKLLGQAIEDIPHNITRFLVISQNTADPTGSDKTSIVFSLKDKVGGLHDILSPFKKNRINLTKIESRPSKLFVWEYYFFVDMEGHISTNRVKRTLEELQRNCIYLKVLGSYPKSED